MARLVGKALGVDGCCRAVGATLESAVVGRLAAGLSSLEDE